jgi:UrcA family protein
LITAAAIKAAPAMAETPAPATNVTWVRTADLNLASDLGQRTLERRLAAAAREVCGSASSADLSGKNAVRRCRDETLSTARATRDRMLATTDQHGAAIRIALAR